MSHTRGMSRECHDANNYQGVWMTLVSAVIKARNEAENIGPCIRSLSGFADEIIVVDDQSSDSTRQIALDCGAIVLSGISHEGQINRLDAQGFHAANGKYLLRLDADERLTPGLAFLLKKVATEGHYAGVRYPRRYYFFNGWLDHGGWFRSEQLGFFRNDAWDLNWNFDIHSQVTVNGKILTLPAEVSACMLHLDYFTVQEFIERSLFKYAKLEASERIRDGYVFSPRTMASNALRRGVGRYFLRSGYKDGARGAIVAGLLVAYEICVSAYAWDLARNDSNEATVV